MVAADETKKPVTIAIPALRVAMFKLTPFMAAMAETPKAFTAVPRLPNKAIVGPMLAVTVSIAAGMVRRVAAKLAFSAVKAVVAAAASAMVSTKGLWVVAATSLKYVSSLDACCPS
jgi:hypothetical protein